MKERFSIRLTPKRISKLRAIAAEREKTMTQMIEDFIDTLPDPSGS